MCKTRVDKKYHFDVNNQWPKFVPVGIDYCRANNQQEYDNLIKEQDRFFTQLDIFSIVFFLLWVGLLVWAYVMLFI